MVAALQRLLGVSFPGYLLEMAEEIKRCQPEVKASKSDNCSLMGLYGYVFDIDNRRRRCLIIAVQTPTRKIFDDPASVQYFSANG